MPAVHALNLEGLEQVGNVAGKVVQASGRQRVKDFIELMDKDRLGISLGIAIWAACGWNEYLTPDWLVDRLRRNCLINAWTLNELVLTKEQNPVTLKRDWLEQFEAARNLMAGMPYETIGCVYLDGLGQPAKGDEFDPAWTPYLVPAGSPCRGKIQ